MDGRAWRWLRGVDANAAAEDDEDRGDGEQQQQQEEEEEEAVDVRAELSGLRENVRVRREFAGAVLDPVLDLVDAELRSAANERRIVAVAGPPGAGKTMLAALVAKFFEASAPGRVAVLAMDAYHLPNKELDARGLRQHKGQPATIDGEALKKDMARIREMPRKALSLPVYDRAQHEPVQDALAIPASVDVVLVEGIHLLRDEEPWKSMCFDAWVLVFADEEQKICRERVVARKTANKVPREDAERHYDRVDAANHQQFNKDARTALARPDRPARLLCISQSTRGPPLAEWHQAPRRPFAGNDSLLAPPSSAVPKLVILGPNPALQKTMVFSEGITIDGVNRAADLRKSVGGKGQQAARAAANFNAAHSNPVARVELVHVLGGANGKAVEDMLHEKGVSMQTVYVAAETRTCLTLVDKTTQEATELIEPSGTVHDQEYDKLLEAVRTSCEEAAAIAICGTAPPGAQAIYRDVVEKAPAQVFLDAYKGVEDALHGVTLLKVNATELRKLAASGPDHDHVDSHSLFACARQLFARYAGLQYLCVTDGPHIASAFSRKRADGYTEFLIPNFSASELVNPIGAGDTVLAVTAASLVHGQDIDVSFARGLAAGSASCLELGGADFTSERLAALFAQVAIADVVVAAAAKAPCK